MTNELKAKFQCQTILVGSDVETPKLTAVYGKDGTPNGQWSKYTPSGSLEMQITNPGARGFFKPGKSYLISFREAGDDE